MNNRKITAAVLAGIMTVSAAPSFAEKPEEINTALNKKATASSFTDEAHKPEMANDGINDNESYSAWIPSESDALPRWTVDMDMEYKISAVEIEPAKGNKISGVKILGSNDENFETFDVLAQSEGNISSGVRLEVKSKNKYRYVRAEKVGNGDFSIGEIKVWVKDSSLSYGSAQENAASVKPADDAETRYDIPADVKGTRIEEQVMLLSALNVMRGYPDGNFLPDDYLSRAEFAYIASKIAGLAKTEGENVFSDVPTEHWAYSAIEACYSVGIVNGVAEGIFEPESKVSTEQAVKMLVCLLGWGEYAEQNGGYPNGYNKAAASLSLMDKVTSGDTLLTRENAAMLVYNSLFARLYDRNDLSNDDTILSKVFKLKKAEGKITEVNGTSLTDEDAGSRKYEYFKIGTEEYLTDDPYYKDLLGYKVKVFYSEEVGGGDLTAAVIIPDKKSKEITIDAEDVSDFNENTISYYDENGKLKKEYLLKGLDVLYNGKPYLKYDFKTLLPTEGEIKMIDSDGDGKYDVLIISGGTTAVVSWIDAENLKIFTKAIGDDKASLLEFSEKDDIQIVDTDGNNVDFSKLVQWDVLTIEESKNNSGTKAVKIIVSKDFVRGDISAMDDEYVTIKNKKYKLTPAMKGHIGMSDRGYFYLDSLGRIAAFDGNEYADGKYGFLSGVSTDDSTEEIKFRIFTSSGAFIDVTASEKFTIDGDVYEIGATRADIITALLKGGGTNGDYQQLVRYTLRGKNEVKAIDTVYTGRNETTENLRKDFELDKRYYKSGVFGMTFSLADDAYVVRIPEDLKREQDYEILSKGYFWEGGQFSFEAYDGGKMKNEKAAVIRTSSTDTISEGARFFLVDKVTTAVTEDGDVMNKLVGLYGGKETEYFEAIDGIIANANLKRGDIITCSVNSLNRVTNIEKKFFKGAKPADAPANSISSLAPMGPNNRTPYWDLYLEYGIVESRDGNYIKVRVNTEDGGSVSNTTYETMLVNLGYSNLYKYVYDSAENEIRLATNADFLDEETMGNADAARVVLRAGQGNVTDIVILK